MSWCGWWCCCDCSSSSLVLLRCLSSSSVQLLVQLVVLPFSSTGFLFPPLSICLRVPLVLVLAEDGGREGYPAVMLLLLFAASGGRIRLLCCSCLLLLKVAEELQLVMTAPLLVHAPSAEQNTATAGDGEKI
ncbi:hypothetical protein H0E87_008494 [Populus deltoides]|nr:hypothetical protein H0E87_008494 [Populus deltoides]